MPSLLLANFSSNWADLSSKPALVWPPARSSLVISALAIALSTRLLATPSIKPLASPTWPRKPRPRAHQRCDPTHCQRSRATPVDAHEVGGATWPPRNDAATRPYAKPWRKELSFYCPFTAVIGNPFCRAHSSHHAADFVANNSTKASAVQSTPSASRSSSTATACVNPSRKCGSSNATATHPSAAWYTEYCGKLPPSNPSVINPNRAGSPKTSAIPANATSRYVPHQ